MSEFSPAEARGDSNFRQEATGDSHFDQEVEDVSAEAWGSAYAGSMVAQPWYPMQSYWPSRASSSSSRWDSSALPFLGRPGPLPPPQKQRFCASFPDVGRCCYGMACAFAHTRDEVTAPLLSQEEENHEPKALTETFFTVRFKTLWCPIGGQHDWQACMYAHTYQDVRRPPGIGYGHQLCPYWNKKDVSLAYSQRCPLGQRCPYAHGAKEQLYHPKYFTTLVCRDLQCRRCPRGQLCVFFHKQTEFRKVGPERVEYSAPLPKKSLPAEWLTYFLSPPRFQEAAGEDGGMIAEMMPGPLGLSGCGPAGSLKWCPDAPAIQTAEEEETTAENESGEGVDEDSAAESEESKQHAQVNEKLEAWPGKQGLLHEGYTAPSAMREGYAPGDASTSAAWATATGADEWGARPYHGGYGGMYQGYPGCWGTSGMYQSQSQWHVASDQ